MTLHRGVEWRYPITLIRSSEVVTLLEGFTVGQACARASGRP